MPHDPISNDRLSLRVSIPLAQSRVVEIRFPKERVELAEHYRARIYKDKYKELATSSYNDTVAIKLPSRASEIRLSEEQRQAFTVQFRTSVDAAGWSDSIICRPYYKNSTRVFIKQEWERDELDWLVKELSKYPRMSIGADLSHEGSSPLVQERGTQASGRQAVVSISAAELKELEARHNEKKLGIVRK
jgi:hypothetical protein